MNLDKENAVGAADADATRSELVAVVAVIAADRVILNIVWACWVIIVAAAAAAVVVSIGRLVHSIVHAFQLRSMGRELGTIKNRN